MDVLNKVAFEEKLKAVIEKTLSDITELEELTKPIGPENAIGRISRMDAINNKSVAEAALRQKRAKLEKLKMALSNLEKKGFGLCASCKRPIQAARLMYLPESTQCVRCAARG